MIPSQFTAARLQGNFTGSATLGSWALLIHFGLVGCASRTFPDPPAGRIGEFDGVDQPPSADDGEGEAEEPAAMWTEEDCAIAVGKVAKLTDAKVADGFLDKCKASQVGTPLDREAMDCFMALEKFHHLVDCGGGAPGGTSLLPDAYTYASSALGPKPKSKWTKDDCDGVAAKVGEWGPASAALSTPALYGHCVESQVGEPLDRNALDCSLKQKSKATAMIKCRMKLPTLKSR